MPKEVKRVLVAAVGVGFIPLGIIGLALPFLQGFLFLAIGLILISISSTRLRTWIRSHTVRYPKLHAAFERTEGWILRIIGPMGEDESNPTPKP